MSQVIVPNDDLKDLRAKTSKQEAAIDVSGEFKKWHKSDVTKPNPVLLVIGVIAAPVIFVWAVLLALGSSVWWAFAMLLSCGASLFAKRS